MDDFFDNRETREYIEALDKVLTPANQRELIQAKAGRYGGTFGHPKLAVFFARWLDIRFAVWCDSIIEDILTKKADLTIPQPEQSATVAVTQVMPPDFMLSIQQLAQGIMFSEQRVAAVLN